MTPFITYFYDKNPTQSNFYETCSLNLEKQLTNFGYKLISENIDFNSLGIPSYEKLTLYQPTYIKNKIKELKSPIIWIDADAQIFDSITEFDNIDNTCDIGFALREHDNKTPHSAFIYFNNTPKSLEFLDLWEQKCKDKYFIECTECTVHCILVDLFKDLFSDIKVCNFKNLASIHNNTKIKIGISPAGWEYERKKSTDLRNQII